MDDCTKSTEHESILDKTQDQKDANDKGETFIQTLKGPLAAFIWVFMPATSATCISLLQRQIPHFELTALRFIMAFLSVLFGLAFKRTLPQIARTEIPSAIMCGLFVFIATTTLFNAVTLVPLTTVQSLFMTSNIISGMILFAIFMRVKITLKQVLFAALCVVGVFMIIQPAFIFHWIQNDNSTTGSTDFLRITNENSTNATEWERVYTNSSRMIGSTFKMAAFGYALSIFTGVAISVNLLLAEIFTCLSDNLIAVLFWAYIPCILIPVTASAIFDKPTLPENWYQVFLVFAHCITFVFVPPLTSCASQCMSRKMINIVVSTSIVFMLIPQYTVLSSILSGHRNWTEVVGFVLDLLGSTFGSALELF